MMTVRAMVDLLRSYPEDMRVVVSGYEQGYDDLSPEQVTVIPVILDSGTHQWEGQHGNPEDSPKTSQEPASITHVLGLHRTSN